jgi:hypothetical protein
MALHASGWPTSLTPLGVQIHDQPPPVSSSVALSPEPAKHKLLLAGADARRCPLIAALQAPFTSTMTEAVVVKPLLSVHVSV